MSVNSVNNNVGLKERWNKLSTPAKIATVAVPVAVAGGTAISYAKGKTILTADQFINKESGAFVEGDKKIKFFDAVKEGLKSIFTKEGREKLANAKTAIENAEKIQEISAGLDEKGKAQLDKLNNAKNAAQNKLDKAQKQTSEIETKLGYAARAEIATQEAAVKTAEQAYIASLEKANVKLPKDKAGNSVLPTGKKAQAKLDKVIENLPDADKKSVEASKKAYSEAQAKLDNFTTAKKAFEESENGVKLLEAEKAKADADAALAKAPQDADLKKAADEANKNLTSVQKEVKEAIFGKTKVKSASVYSTELDKNKSAIEKLDKEVKETDSEIVKLTTQKEKAEEAAEEANK